MNFMKEIIFSNKLLALQLLTEQIESQGIDIAPAYGEYVAVCFAIANDCGEAGREYFHRICRLYAHYSKEDVENLFNNSLAHGEKRNGLGSVFELAKSKGVNVKVVQERIRRAGGLVIQRDAKDAEDAKDARSFFGGSNGSFEEIEGLDPVIKLPTFGQHEHPWPLNDLGIGTFSDYQRDARFLATIAVLGSTLGYKLCTYYSGKYRYPNFQVFITGKSASGKSSIGAAKSFAMPRHKKCLEDNKRKLDAYKLELLNYKKQLKNAGDTSMLEPEMPKKKLFVIPGNNTNSGLRHNVINSGGVGLIFESEADTLSSSIKGKYGQFNELLRIFDDNDGISMSRSSDDVHEEIDKTCVGVVLSGTPEQIKNFVESAENGLFSRQLFLYIPEIGHWVSQFPATPKECTDAPKDVRVIYEEQSLKWAEVLDKVQECSPFVFVLNPEQVRAFDAKFSRLYEKANKFGGGEMNGSVCRLAVSIMRIMTVYAFLRGVEKKDFEWDEYHDCNNHYVEYYITDYDFNYVLSMADVLYTHINHVLSFLKSPVQTRRGNVERDKLFETMGDEFKMSEFLDMAKEYGINKSTAKSWLKRDVDNKNGIFEMVDGNGSYRRRRNNISAPFASSAS